ncbi:hypothetical protein B8042_14400 [Escherichia coli]|nr:hypothetical protein B8042_14400 [Escherichia coli]
MGKAVIAIHGGAGAISRAQMSLQQELRYIEALSAIVETGQKMLEAGESALDVVTEAVRLLEECPLFNAGIGAVFTRDETHELDACVMDGNTLKAGAVAGVSHLRNPVLAARLVTACDDDWRRGRKFCVCSWHGARLAGDFLHAFAL